MNRPKQYLLDEEPIDFRELIQQAKDVGYESLDGIYTTSGAICFLKDNYGCKIEVNPDCK